MQPVLDYMLKISVCLAVTGMFYFLLLRRLTQYTYNRWFLLACLALSFIIPFINVNNFVTPDRFNRVVFVNKIPAIHNTLPTASGQTNSFLGDMQTLLLILYMVTAGVLFLRLVIQFLSLKKITRKAQLINKGAVLLYNLPENIAPFSFNRSIYINTSMYNASELADVIRHETVHVKQRHTVDVMLAELVCILNWYNPFAWILKTAIKQNLEFIADDAVLKSNTNRQDYQYLLLKVTGNIPLAITNNLNFSSLKNRIAMMNKSKTSRLHLLKFMFALPIACFLLLAFRQAYNNTGEVKSHKVQQTTDETFTLGTLTYAVNDAEAETLIKREQGNSFLKPGNVLSLSSIQNEKFRLSNLLRQNGYDTSGGHAVYFMVDTFSTNKSFSIQITINVPRNKTLNKNTNGAFQKNMAPGLEERRFKSKITTGAERNVTAPDLQYLALQTNGLITEKVI